MASTDSSGAVVCGAIDAVPVLSYVLGTFVVLGVLAYTLGVIVVVVWVQRKWQRFIAAAGAVPLVAVVEALSYALVILGAITMQ